MSLTYTPAHPTLRFPQQGSWTITDLSGWYWVYFESGTDFAWHSVSRMDPLPTGDRLLFGVFSETDRSAVEERGLPPLPVTNSLNTDL